MVHRTRLLAIILSSLLLLTGLSYLIYLHFVFPNLVPFHGSGERFSLNQANNYTFQIPWSAHSRLHLTVQTSETVEIYINDDYVGNFTHYDFVMEPGEYAMVLLKSNSPVSGMFTAWQEIPFENQMFAVSLFLTGVVTATFSAKKSIKRKR